MSPDALAAAGVPDAAAVVAAAAPVAGWLAAARATEVTDGLAAAADPVGAVHGLVRLLAAADRPPQPGRVAPLLRVLGGSPRLAAVLAAEGEGWPALVETMLGVARRDVGEHAAALAAAGVAGPLGRAELAAALRRYHRRELVRIGGRDLVGLATVDETMRELTALAEALIEAALGCIRARLLPEWNAEDLGFAVLGMGKLGGGELNYSSDIDLVYVYARDGELPGGRTVRELATRVGEEVTRALAEVTADGFCFRVDLRLRPGGGEGPVAVSQAAALSYYESWGQTWERAAWLKARAVAGDRALGGALLAELEPFVYRRYLDFGTLADLEAMKRKVDVSLRDPAARARDVKLGRGGIREVEFFVQAQQLVHAGKDARLRVRGTLPALERLAVCGYVPAAQAAELAQAYRFLRDVEHKLQVVHQRQTHRLPDDPTEATHLARRLGFRGPDALTAFAAALAGSTAVVHAAFDGLFHGAEAERRRAEEPALTTLVEELEQADAAQARLATLGFADAEAAYRNLRLLRDGPPHAPASPRRRQALAALAPSLLREIARSATPDRALHHTATFLSTIGARTSYLHLLLENPGVMRLLVRLFASSEYLSQFFLRHPELLDSLVRADLVRVRRAREDLAAELDARLAAAPDLEAELDELRRFRHEEFLRIGIHDIEGELAPEEVSAQLSTLAEVCLAAASALARREVLRRNGLPPEPPTDGLAILGLGKLGGAELDYNSDLDLVFVYDPGPEAWWAARMPAHDFFTRVAQRTISVLQTTTREGIAYRIDTRLRPSGNQGPLVCSLEAFARYHRTAAAVWERQALVKARVLTGPAALRARLEAIVAACVYGRGLDAAEAAEIARLRERMAHERGAGDGRQVNIKTGRGGLVDVEFLVQALQLRHGHAHPALRVPGTRAALAALAAEGLLSAEDARMLGAGYDFLRALENRLRLERDQPVEALDTDPSALLPLARRLGYGGTDAEAVARLRAEHARTRAAIRAVYERHLRGG